MYVQSLFAEQRTQELDALIAAYPLGSLVIARPSGVAVDHLPCSMHPEVGANGMLRCHAARGNPLWRSLLENGEVMVIFQSPSAYISPTWMPGRKRHGKVAPSWNYAAVHVYGMARIVEDAAWLQRHLHALSAPQETTRAEPWTLAEAPPEFVAQLLPLIVGIEITIDRKIGKWFVGQQRSPADRAGVVAGLLQEHTDAATTIANLMQAYAPSREEAPGV